jgi:hydroxymethylpyrimidine pyrophosphatase-like HAD family hydrolase
MRYQILATDSDGTLAKGKRVASGVLEWHHFS